VTGTLARLQPYAVSLARIILGVVLFAHGWQKFFTNGIDKVQLGFEHMGVPAPGVSAWFAGLVELVGGPLLVIGVAVPLVAVLGIIDMIGAIATAHWPVLTKTGSLIAPGGPELPLVILAGLLAVGFAAQGPLSVDHHLFGRRR
jgi:putative oxidoreductase